MPQPVLITTATLEQLTGKLAGLKRKLAQSIPETKHAYETGGYWHDNFAWDEMRRRQADLKGQIREIEEVLFHHILIDRVPVDTSRVGVGTTIRLRYRDTGEETNITILGPFESDPDRGIVSHQAPFTQALLGKSIGEMCVFNDR